LSINGIRLRAYPKIKQKNTLSQWLGCARVIWNAKCEEELYQRTFARKYLPMGTYPKIDQTYSQYKSTELTPWLSDCPSQILRNSAVNWYNTYKNFLQGRCGRPKRKRVLERSSIYLTRELFQFETDDFGNIHLFIGTKKNNIGYLAFKHHKNFEIPASIRIIREQGKWFVSFCYEDCSLDDVPNQPDLNYLRSLPRQELEEIIVGIDRGVVRPIQVSNGDLFQLSLRDKKKAAARKKYIRGMQRASSRENKRSNRRKKKLLRIGKLKAKEANIRRDFNHKSSRIIVNTESTKVIVLENLKTKNMTRRPKAKRDNASGDWKKNGAKQKKKLTTSILDRGWQQFETFLHYKATRLGKLVVKVSPHHTSQECADCGHIHPNNRKDQINFSCESCGHSENADVNASRVIKKRAINLILDSGTELSSKGILLDKGRGAQCKTTDAKATIAGSCEASKKREKVLVA